MSGPDPTIATLGRDLRRRTLTSEALTAACLERIEALNPRLNAFIAISDRALTDARRADRELRAGRDRGPLHGLPVSLKDLIDVAGLPTTAGSRVRRGLTATHDAPVVTRLRRAGAVLLGKCNLHEFAYGPTGDDSAFGPTRHPRDPGRMAGGSSSGSAAAVAANLGVASLGTDTGGSIRIPAALCGIVGLKPAYGALPCGGIVPLAESLDHVGPLARSVDDVWAVFNVLADLAPPRGTGPRRLRLAVPRRYFLDELDDGVRETFDDALARLRRAGHTIDAVDIPHAADVGPVYLHIQAPEASEYHAKTLREQPSAYGPATRWRLEAGRYLLAEDARRARRGQRLLRQEVDAALAHRHALVLPTAPILAPPLGATHGVVSDRLHAAGRRRPLRPLLLKLTQLFNVTGHPAVTIPCGESAGLPVGLQLVGPTQGTSRLLQVARACERRLDSRGSSPAA